VRANRLSDHRDSTVPVWLQVPLAKLDPGRYDCQLNLIDEFGRRFAFPRTSLAVLPVEPAAAPAETPSH